MSEVGFYCTYPLCSEHIHLHLLCMLYVNPPSHPAIGKVIINHIAKYFRREQRRVFGISTDT